jgi:hypothetical protein
MHFAGHPSRLASLAPQDDGVNVSQVYVYSYGTRRATASRGVLSFTA